MSNLPVNEGGETPAEDQWGNYSSPYSSGYSPQDTPPYATQPPPVRAAAGQPVVTYVLIAISVILYILQGVQGLIPFEIPVLLDFKINSRIIQGEYWRLITPTFLHGGILHIGFNMYALMILGRTLERYFGHARFLALYLLSGFAGNVISFLFTPAPSLGASTAVFGLIGAQGVFLFQNRDLFAGRVQQALQQTIMIAVVNLMIGLSPGIDNWGHIGGLAGGLLFTSIGGPLIELVRLQDWLEITDRRKKEFIFLAAGAVFFGFALLAAWGISVRS